MPSLNNISAHIIVHGTALHEYSGPKEGTVQPNSATRYIEIVPNVPFKVFVSVPPQFEFLGDVLVFRVLLNGVEKTEFWHKPVPSDLQQRHQRGAEQKKYEGIYGSFSGNDGEPLTFPHVVQYDNDNAPGDVEAWKDKEVVLQISHGRMIDPHETASYGSSTDSIQAVGGPESIQTFTFKYRPRNILQSIFREVSRAPHPRFTTEVPEEGAHSADNAWKDTLQPTRNAELYCSCGRVRPTQRVITCDNDACRIKSYHWNCVNLKEEPKRTWLCPTCLELPEEELVVEGSTDYWRHHSSYTQQNCEGCTESDGMAWDKGLGGGKRGE